MTITPDPLLLIEEIAEEHAHAKPGIYHWCEATKAAEWKTPEDVKRTFNSVDFVKAPSGSTLAVFNISGKKFRLIARILYAQSRVIFLRLLPHHVYSKGRWLHEL